MKNTFLLVIAGLIFSASADAQKKNKPAAVKTKVPESVNESFKGTYADVDKSKWNQTYTGNYVAVFNTADSSSKEVEYNANGVMVKTKTVYNSAAFPENISSAIGTKYPDAKVIEAVKMEIPGVNPYYKVKLETATNAKKELFISEEGIVAE